MKRRSLSFILILAMILIYISAFLSVNAADTVVLPRITVEIPVENARVPDFYMTLTNIYSNYRWGSYDENHPHIIDSTVFDMSKEGTVSFSHPAVLEWRVDGHIWKSRQVGANETVRLTDPQFVYQRDIIFMVIIPGFTQVNGNEILPNRVYFRFFDPSADQTGGVTVKGTGETQTLAAGYTPPLTVSPTPSTVFVNGTATQFEAYLINDKNYFKLRDLAMAIRGTNKQFEVGYNDATRAITLTSGLPYTRTGGELVPGDGISKRATFNSGIIIDKDGVPVHIKAYLIPDNNFIMLRDLMSLLDIYVGYDEATRNITIDTSLPYSD